MDIRVSKRVDLIFSGVLAAVIAAVAAHLFMPDFVAGVQWFIVEVLEPTFGLDDLILGS